jgi:hypothetical protein
MPLEELEAVPQPLVVQLEALLEKDPARAEFRLPQNFEGGTDDNKCLGARRRITRQSLQSVLSSASRVGTRKQPARLAPDKISLARLPVTGSEIFGREEDLIFWIVRGPTRM